jgi:hypothetical protein
MRTPTVCKDYLDNLLAYLGTQGVSARQLQSVLRLDPLGHLSEQGRVPLRLFELTLDAGASLLNDPCLGAHAGTHCSRTPWGMVDYLGMSAANSREAVDAMQRYSRLLIDHGDMVLSEINSETACLSWLLPARKQASRHVVEFFFANWYRVNKPMLDKGGTRREVHFAHGGGGREQRMADLFEAPVKFGKKSKCGSFWPRITGPANTVPTPGDIQIFRSGCPH